MIILKSDQEIDAMKPAGHLAYRLLNMVEEMIRPGISTLEIDQAVHSMTIKEGGTSAPLHYQSSPKGPAFPRSICTSRNHVVCHGIPSKNEILREGDIINVDVTPIVNGYHGDSSRTFFVGSRISDTARKLVACSQKCLELGISAVRVGGRIGDIGHVIQEYAHSQGFSVVRDFVGHGIGRGFHEDPQVPHYGKQGRGERLTPGMVFTIEPMINEKDYRCKVLRDGWTAVTLDGRLSAQFEHTIAIRENGDIEILTLAQNSAKESPENSAEQPQI